MTNYYIPIIYIVPLISVDGQASPRLFIAPEIRHEKISYMVHVQNPGSPIKVDVVPIVVSFFIPTVIYKINPYMIFNNESEPKKERRLMLL